MRYGEIMPFRLLAKNESRRPIGFHALVSLTRGSFSLGGAGPPTVLHFDRHHGLIIEGLDSSGMLGCSFEERIDHAVCRFARAFLR